MTEKRDLNNELILMKPNLKQAKVFAIRKLVRKLKNLRTQKGQELTGLQLIGKKSRLTGQIDYLKKIPNLELAKLALRFDKNPNQILTNQLSSIEDASLANIVIVKTVSDKLKQIKTKFGLDESADGWQEKVQEIGKKKKKKLDKETYQRRNKDRKEAQKKRNELVKKRDEWLENAEKSDDASEIDEEDNSKKVSAKREKNSTNVSNNNTKKRSVKKLTSDPLKTVDSFFVTETGESYLATKVVDRIQPRGPNDGLDRKERRAQRFGSKPKAKRNGTLAGPSGSTQSTTTSKGSHSSAKRKVHEVDEFKGKKMKFVEEQINNLGSASTPQPTEKIHPSWAAKQKLKPVISEFLGSKIVFDD